MKKLLQYGLALAVLASIFVMNANAEDPIRTVQPQIADKIVEAAKLHDQGQHQKAAVLLEALIQSGGLQAANGGLAWLLLGST
jgi:hypothetical protein